MHFLETMGSQTLSMKYSRVVWQYLVSFTASPPHERPSAAESPITLIARGTAPSEQSRARGRGDVLSKRASSGFAIRLSLQATGSLSPFIRQTSPSLPGKQVVSAKPMREARQEPRRAQRSINFPQIDASAEICSKGIASR